MFIITAIIDLAALTPAVKQVAGIHSMQQRYGLHSTSAQPVADLFATLRTLVSHPFLEALKAARRLWVMCNGCVVTCGNCAHV